MDHIHYMKIHHAHKKGAKLLKKYDTNKDGKLDFKEAMVAPSIHRDDFTVADVNKDGFLDAREMPHAVLP